jgi:hypothetical protein
MIKDALTIALSIATAAAILAALPWIMKAIFFYFDYASWVLGK